MQTDPNKSVMSESNRATSSKLSRDLVALGRKHSQTGFPNPNREGCPKRAVLQAMANRDPRLTLENIPASHIVTCSPCFQDYTHLRRRALLFRGVRIALASLAAAAMFIAALVLWNRAHNPNSPGSLTAQGPNDTKRQTASVEPVPMTVDLAAYSLMRGDANPKAQKKLGLPKHLLRLNFILPLGMEPGTYEIRLQDPSGRAFFDKDAHGSLVDGVGRLLVDIDLTAAPSGNFTLMIRPPGLEWRRFPAEVD